MQHRAQHCIIFLHDRRKILELTFAVTAVICVWGFLLAHLTCSTNNNNKNSNSKHIKNFCILILMKFHVKNFSMWTIWNKAKCKAHQNPFCCLNFAADYSYTLYRCNKGIVNLIVMRRKHKWLANYTEMYKLLTHLHGVRRITKWKSVNFPVTKKKGMSKTKKMLVIKTCFTICLHNLPSIGKYLSKWKKKKKILDVLCKLTCKLQHIFHRCLCHRRCRTYFCSKLFYVSRNAFKM